MARMHSRRKGKSGSKKPVKKTVSKKSTKKIAIRKTKPKKSIIKKKNAVKQIIIKPTSKGKLIGRIAHFFDKIGVTVIKLNAPLVVGDRIQIIGGETDFQQTVKSMQIEHEQITKAKATDEIGMKVDKKVREGYKVFKI